jgi:hypothetical protein
MDRRSNRVRERRRDSETTAAAAAVVLVVVAVAAPSSTELLGDVALIAAALAAWRLAVRHRGRRAPAALAVLLTFLALDHATGLHDRVPHWRLVYLPLLAATFLALVVVADGGSSAGRRLVLTGLVLLGGSLVLHEIGGWLIARAGAAPDGWVFQLKVGVKHGTEVAGWVLVALGLIEGRRVAGTPSSLQGPGSGRIPSRGDQSYVRERATVGRERLSVGVRRRRTRERH